MARLGGAVDRHSERLQVTAPEQVELQQSPDQLHSESELAHELEIGDQQIHAYGHPDLCQYGVARSAEKGFDFRVLLDPLEAQLDRPARSPNLFWEYAGQWTCLHCAYTRRRHDGQFW